VLEAFLKGFVAPFLKYSFNANDAGDASPNRVHNHNKDMDKVHNKDMVARPPGVPVQQRPVVGVVTQDMTYSADRISGHIDRAYTCFWDVNWHIVHNSHFLLIRRQAHAWL
jgi:hypothetical protein